MIAETSSAVAARMRGSSMINLPAGLLKMARHDIEEQQLRLCGFSERQGAANHLLHAAFNLLAALGEGVHDHGQQPVQRLADGRRLARQIAIIGFPLTERGALHLATTMGGTRDERSTDQGETTKMTTLMELEKQRI